MARGSKPIRTTMGKRGDMNRGGKRGGKRGRY